MIDIDALAQQFWKDGYIVVKNFFDSEVMDDLNQQIIEHFGMKPAFEHTDEFIEKSAVEVVPWFPQREGVTSFDVIGKNDQLNALTNTILDNEWYEQYAMVMFSKKGTKGQAWHQDCPPTDPKKFNMNRLIYTMDIDAELTGGQTMVMPGSHKQGLLPSPSEAFDESKAVTLTPKKGDLVLLHGHCYHKVTEVTGQYRVSTNFRVAPEGTPEDITDIGVYRNMLYQFSTSSVVEERT
ncbi:phytanoyl-CoA dioxygenase family protein [Thalassotalea agarivorans]|uniref:Phytanoyl-CoA dioxygenase (PhyH) n=1 Tax=Thalassotalea agarivorans TaxID=349064 RepID=A0A1I0BSS0_THASX|nr:phytanoyl-CoA dioxygenase family protein [Thalassotalea agarivorans]SET10107.1 Phytanoyl-CoA dioxygenase (PhyH) [Thalassotalea agarivorans]